jgi:dTDP-glucose 4,6-dehydratase
MHIFVTGGTGFFGKALLRYWSTGSIPQLTGARFTLLSRAPEQFARRHAELLDGLAVDFHHGDMQQPDTLPVAGAFTHVLHAAADTINGPRLSPLEHFDQITAGTRNILEMSRRLGVRRLLLASSGGVYGSPTQFPDGIPETWHGMPDPLLPQNAYGVAKRQAEHLCALYGQACGLETVIARCFAFVGEDLPLDAHFAIGNFIRDALAGKAITIQGDGTPIRSYLDQRDLARWLTVLLLRGRTARAYNVGSDRPVSIDELAHVVARHAATRPPDVHVMNQAASQQTGHRNYYLPDISRVRSELGLDLKFSLDMAIRHTLARHRVLRGEKLAPNGELG